MKLTIVITKICKGEREHLYSMDFIDKRFGEDTVGSNKNTVPSLIDKAINEILATSIPEKLTEIGEKEDAYFDFSIVGKGVNIQFSLEDKIKK